VLHTITRYPRSFGLRNSGGMRTGKAAGPSAPMPGSSSSSSSSSSTTYAPITDTLPSFRSGNEGSSSQSGEFSSSGSSFGSSGSVAMRSVSGSSQRLAPTTQSGAPSRVGSIAVDKKPLSSSGGGLVSAPSSSVPYLPLGGAAPTGRADGLLPPPVNAVELGVKRELSPANRVPVRPVGASGAGGGLLPTTGGAGSILGVLPLVPPALPQQGPWYGQPPPGGAPPPPYGIAYPPGATTRHGSPWPPLDTQPHGYRR